MNFGKLIQFFITALLAIFFILAGAACLIIPWSLAVRTHIILFIIESTPVISSFGLLFVILGATLLINVILSSKHRYYSVKGTGGAVQVDESLIQQLLDRYFSELFPGKDVPNNLVMSSSNIHIIVNFPYFPTEEQKPLLNKVEAELAQLLDKALGYKQTFFLSASFSDKKLLYETVS
jgi:hypothetical protein